VPVGHKDHRAVPVPPSVSLWWPQAASRPQPRSGTSASSGCVRGTLRCNCSIYRITHSCQGACWVSASLKPSQFWDRLAAGWPKRFK
jgi:hypothetical protein